MQFSVQYTYKYVCVQLRVKTDIILFYSFSNTIDTTPKIVPFKKNVLEFFFCILNSHYSTKSKTELHTLVAQ